MKTLHSRLFFAIVLLLLRAAATAASAPPAHPNILWLIAEDMGPEALSRSGTPQASTPTIDRLATEGVYYSHTYLGMVCSVSRSAFMTGMYATTIGAHHHRTMNKKPLPAGVRVLTDWLRDAGYFTANLVQLPPALGFRGAGKTDWNFTYEGKPFDSAAWSDLKDHQPFYAQLNFQETHRLYHAPAKADPATVVLPPYYPDHPVARKDWAQYLDSAIELDRKIALVLQQLAADGLADNTIILVFGDNGASMVRAKQFCYEESFHVPLIVRWPANFPAPADVRPGSEVSRFVDGIDFAPTMLAFAGVAKPAKMQGKVFVGPHAEPASEFTFGSRDRCDETSMRLRGVRDARYRYIRNFTPEVPFLAPNNYKETQYPVWNLLKELHAAGTLTPPQEFLCQPRQPAEELYDLASDPHELHNLANSTAPADVAELKKLRAALEHWIVETDDQGRFPEVNPPKTAAEAAGPAAGKNKKK
jgi:arylsulfatase A-like enzyme